MALSDASGDPLAHSNGGHHHLTSANASTPASDGQDPLMLTPDADLNLTVCTVQQKPQRLHGIQKTNRSNQSLNGSVVKQNGSLRNLPSPSTAISSPATITDSQRLTKCQVPSTLSPSSPSPPGLCCQHCHLRSTLACPCGQQECPSTGPRAIHPTRRPLSVSSTTITISAGRITFKTRRLESAVHIDFSSFVSRGRSIDTDLDKCNSRVAANDSVHLGHIPASYGDSVYKPKEWLHVELCT
ncbi:hypothetical protein D4764_19G0001140 [Takifugu flavidus]|uniref:Uncharacterized protein n=1 Tax=Takifugu flavidus TaxID=433684 RepID=A0A5C6NMN3_9TELE|nr:hypothetical protein D4764_19G0001140 [Takifugu flavidus]